MRAWPSASAFRWWPPGTRRPRFRFPRRIRNDGRAEVFVDVDEVIAVSKLLTLQARLAELEQRLADARSAADEARADAERERGERLEEKARAEQERARADSLAAELAEVARRLAELAARRPASLSVRSGLFSGLLRRLVGPRR